MNDSRKEDRLPVALVMRYREPTMLEAREGQCQNVSLNGMCILTQKPSPRGALIRFECVSGGMVGGIRGTGRVVWQRSKSDARGPAGMGVRFVRLEPGCSDALESLLDQLGREHHPSSAPPQSREKKRHEPASDRPGRSTQLFAPVPTSPLPLPPTGTTQQGMGAARNRAGHYPTLRGLPTSSSPPPPDDADANGSAPTARATAPDGVEKRKASGAMPASLGATLPGHPTVTNSPFPPSHSAPPPEPHDGSSRPTSPAGARSTSGGLRDRLDRTRRGMPPPSSASEAELSDVKVMDEVTARTNVGSDRPPKERKSDRPPTTGGVESLGSTPSSRPSDGASARSNPSSDRPPPNVTAEPVDTVGARRRAARAADISSAIPSLPDPDGSQRRNWLPWVVVGAGLLVSGLIVKMFGTVPAGIPTGVDTGTLAAEAAGQTPPNMPPPGAPKVPSAASAASSPPNSNPASAPGATAAPAAGQYILEVISDPPGARVSAAGQWVLAPATVELAGLNAPLEVRAEFAGRKSTSITVAPSQFVRNGDRFVYRAELKLPAEPTPSPTPATHEPKEQPAPVTTPAAAKPTRSERQARVSRPAAPAAVEAAPPPPAHRVPTPSDAPQTPQIAQPPVPIAPATASRATPASEAEPANAPNTPLAKALECLSRGDNPCVVAALEGHAKNERELGVLIETYLVMGNAADAERNMRSYIGAYPNGKSAQKFQRWLERRNESTPASP